MYPSLALLIDGSWHGLENRESQAVYNPATEEYLGELPHADINDINKAIEAAACAFEPWRATTALERGRLLMSISSRIRAASDELSLIITLEQGKTLEEARAEVNSAADTFEWMAEEGKRAYGRVVPSRFSNAEQIIVREPIGPVAAFSPWNYPCALASRKIATALAAGCTIVIKPAEETPGILVAIGRICVDAGLPPGVLNIIFGNPEQISSHLIASSHIKKISFTGSVPVGRHLALLAGKQMKKITLELGGHSPVLITDDVDVEKVARMAVMAKFRNAGQVCHCPTRFFVQRSISTKFGQALAARAQELVVGDGRDAGTTMGPLINQRSMDRISALTQDALEANGNLLTGGKALERPGHFWMPTVIDNPQPHALALHDEPFGPFALVMPFDELEEVLEVANSTKFGLASYAFTNSLSVAKRIQDGIQAGCLSINTFAMSPPELPFSGIKQSGFGSEMGSEGLMDHFLTKTIVRTVL